MQPKRASHQRGLAECPRLGCALRRSLALDGAERHCYLALHQSRSEVEDGGTSSLGVWLMSQGPEAPGARHFRDEVFP